MRYRVARGEGTLLAHAGSNCRVNCERQSTVRADPALGRARQGDGPSPAVVGLGGVNSAGRPGDLPPTLECQSQWALDSLRKTDACVRF